MVRFAHSLALLLVTYGPDSGFAQRPCTSVDTEGFWKFNEVDGPILDAYDRSGTNDCTSYRANNGFVGSWSGFDDTADVLDRHGGGRVQFDGLSPNHIVMIGPDHHEDFNADRSSLLWRVKAKLEPDALSNGKMESVDTWNLMQKGRFNQFGMWKMQIMPFKESYWEGSNLAFIQTSNWPDQATTNDPILHCQVQDENNVVVNAYSRVRLEPGVLYRLRCVLDRTNGELKAIVSENQSKDRIEEEAPPYKVYETPLPEGLGLVSPGLFANFACSVYSADKDWPPVGFGGHNLNDFVAIGNKPECPGWENKATPAQLKNSREDGFKGKVYQAKIEKPRNF